MCKIGVRSADRISIFFSPAAGFWPPPNPSRRPWSPTHLSCRQPVRPGRRLDECRNRRTRSPAGKGWHGSVRRTVSDAMSKTHDANGDFASIRAQFPEPRRLSSDSFWRIVLSSARYLARSPFSPAISEAMSYLCYYNWRNVLGKTTFSADLPQNAKKVGRPEPLPCPPSSVEMPACGPIGWPPCPAAPGGSEIRRGGLSCLQ